MSTVIRLYPFGRTQLGMLTDILTGSEGLHVEQLAVTLPDPVDPDVLQRAWAQQVAAHEALRTCVVVDGGREPVFCVIDAVLACLQEQRVDGSSVEWCDKARRRRIDLEQAPLAHLALLHAPGEATILVLTYSHLILDGWSVRLLMTGLRSGYLRLLGGDTSILPVDDLARVRAHQLRVAPNASDWLRDRLSQVRHATHPFAPPSTERETKENGTVDHCEIARKFTPAEMKIVMAATHTNRVGMVTWVQATWALLLQSRTRAERVIFGVTTTVRPPQIEGIEHLIGMLVTTVPVVVERASSVAALLAEVRAVSLRLPEIASGSGGDVPATIGLPAGIQLYESVVVSQFASAPLEGEVPLFGGTMDTAGARTRHALVILVSGADLPILRMVGRSSHYNSDVLAQLLDDFFAVMFALASLPPNASPERAVEFLPQDAWWHAPLSSPEVADPVYSSTLERVHACWRRVCGGPTPQTGELPWDVSGVSSLAMVHLKADIEHTFDVTLSLAKLVEQTSLDAVAAMVERCLQT